MMINQTAQSAVSILIVDDHPLVRDGLKARLKSRPDWHVCGEAETVTDALRLCHEHEPDVVLVDLSLKGGNGLDLIKQLASHPHPPKILVCSMHDENLYAQRAIQAGAMGFVHKQQAAELIVPAISRILEGRLFVSDEISDRVLTRMLREPGQPAKNPIEQLTDRELQVFEAIGRGQTMAQIAASLFLSVKTVETYRDRAKRKLHLRTSAELMRYAIKWVTENACG